MKIRNETITTAERRIAQILAELEIQAEGLVLSLSIEDVEVTNFNDDRKRMARRVIIEIERSPGSNWAT
jgi:hypothetical protein